MPVPVLAGAATLDPGVLVDSLVPDVIDGLREALHPAFGVRSYRTYRVIRTWSGTELGDGTPTDDAAELRPQPRVAVWDGFNFQEQPAGLEASGRVRLTEVSLSYTEAQLTAHPLGALQEAFIAIGDGNGQASTVYLFTHLQPPYIDREKDMGWVLNLQRVYERVAWAP